MLERTRSFLAGLVLPLLYWLIRLSLRLLPPTHPFRIYATNRAETMGEMVSVAVSINQPGKRLPVVLNFVLAYLLLDSMSPRIKGPTDLIEWWSLDERIRIIQRLQDFPAHGAPLFAGLLHLL